VSARTVERDFERLRNRLGAPLRYDSRERRWVYTENSYGVPSVQITQGELVAVFLAERLMQQYRGTPFESHLQSAFEKIVQWLPQQVSVDLSAFSQAYSFEIGPISEISAETVDAIGRATLDRETVEINYYSQSRGEMTVRRINPYHVHNYRGDWYVIAFDHLRREMRDFHIGRIHSFQLTGERFRAPADFDIKAYLSSGFSMVRGKREYLVEIEFSSYQSRWIRERKKWHESEEREDLPNGGLLLRMKLGGLDAVKRFVLQYGSHAIVHRPALLKKMVEEEIRKMAVNYGIQLAQAKDTAGGGK